MHGFIRTTGVVVASVKPAATAHYVRALVSLHFDLATTSQKWNGLNSPAFIGRWILRRNILFRKINIYYSNGGFRDWDLL